MSLNIPEQPTCGVVVEKALETQEEKVCGEPATQLVSMVDPEIKSQIIAILLLCDRHDKELDEGKSLIFLSDDGSDHIAVAYRSEGS